MRKARLYELDILRALGTLVIVFHHLPDYAGNFYDLEFFGIPLDLSYVNVVNTYFGLGIFVFVSGFVLSFSYPRVERFASFFVRRMIRIMPLYLVALAIFALTFQKLSGPETVIHALGLHIALAPRLADPMPTLWFVGLIVLFYLFFALLMLRDRGTRGIILFSLSFLGVMIVVRVFLNIVEYRFFNYFPIFVAGILANRTGFFERHKSETSHLAAAAVIVVASVLFFRFARQGLISEEVTEMFIEQASVLEVVLTALASNIVMLSLIFGSYVLSQRIKPKLNQPAKRLLSLISFASFGVYLFHRPALGLFTRALGLFPSMHPYLRLFLLIIVAIPLIFALSYGLQTLDDRITQRLLRRAWELTAYE